jgi:serine/threonine protein phosphatase PrpC
MSNTKASDPAIPPRKLTVLFGGYSTRGQRDINQDAFAVHKSENSDLEAKGTFAAIADGVSSASHGKEAAQLAVSQTGGEYMSTPDSWSTTKSLSKVLCGLNSWLCSQSKQLCLTNNKAKLQSNAQWLTTFSGLILKSASATLFHIGDSRIYQYRQSKLEQLTEDHQSNYGLNSQVLSRALGADYHLKVDIQSLELYDHDCYLLTTDGLHNFLSQAEISRQLTAIGPDCKQAQLEKIAQGLAKQAIANGSDDNISCLLIYVKHTACKNLDEVARHIATKATLPALTSGQLVDNFKVIRVIHASPRSHLYLVENLESQQLCVIKAPSANFEDNAFYRQSFLREAWLGERVKQPNIMAIKAAHANSKFLYHVCEYIQGQTLSQWLLDHPKPSLSQVRPIIEQLILALRTFERLELVHRDLKPDNIMITEQGQVKLIDYGAVLIPALCENSDNFSCEHPLGAVNYVAPETLNQLQTDTVSDLFSLGVICYELLTGSLPFKAMTVASSKLKQVDKWQYLSIRHQRPELPLWVDLCLQKACHPNRDKRYQVYSEFYSDLSKANHNMLEAYQSQPLLARDPLCFWQLCSLILACLLLISLIY